MRARTKIVLGACLLAGISAGVLALQPGASGQGLLGSAQLAQTFGRDPRPCDCNGLSLKNDCNVDGCPACKNENGCGVYAVVGTGYKYNLCTSGNPNTGFCDPDGDPQICTKKYDCTDRASPIAGYKCNPVNTACVQGETGNYCTLCIKGQEWLSGKTWQQNYKCQ